MIQAAAILVSCAVLLEPVTVAMLDRTERTGEPGAFDRAGFELTSDGGPERLAWTEVRPGQSWIPDEFAPTHELALLLKHRASIGDIPGAARAAFELAPSVAGEPSEVSSAVATVLYEDATRRGNPYEAAVASMIPGAITLRPSETDDRHMLPLNAPPVRTQAAVPWSIDRSLVEPKLNQRDALVLELYTLVETGSRDQAAIEGALSAARQVNGDLGLELVSHMVTAQLVDDPTQREAARTRLLSRAVSRRGTWIDAWARLALAHSFLNWGGDEDVSSALVQLTHVAVRFETAHPKLANLAKRTIHDTLEASGRRDELIKFLSAFAASTPDLQGSTDSP